MKVLFLGIDPYMAFVVGKIQLDTDCQVVLSSSWRHSKDGIKEVERQVVKLLDKTGVCRDVGGIEAMRRGKEIKAWLDVHPEVLQYAIIDDNNDMLPEQQPNFFKTSWFIGITEEIAKEITEHLNTVV